MILLRNRHRLYFHYSDIKLDFFFREQLSKIRYISQVNSFYKHIFLNNSNAVKI